VRFDLRAGRGERGRKSSRYRERDVFNPASISDPPGGIEFDYAIGADENPEYPMTALRKSRQKGSAIVESALVLMPLLLTILVTADLSRAMWTYHTLARAVKTGTRLAIVHGSRCADASAACPITVGNVVSAIQNAGVGLDPTLLQLTLVAGSQSTSCNPSGSCTANASAWPPASNNAVGLPLTITAQYNFNSVLSFLFQQGSISLTGQSTEVIEF
jgi:Flp pilus assembly protein TadG